MIESIHISVVSPVYRAEELVLPLVKSISENLSKITAFYEIILVEDGSPDKSWDSIVKAAEQYPKVKGVKLSRNFGQHNAITAGLSESQGEWIVVMDCDLQDNPTQIAKLYSKTKEGYDLVFAQRIDRQDTFFKKLFSKWFYKVFSYFTETKQDSTVANFGIYHRDAVDAILKLQDQVRFFPTMSQWVGFNKAYVEVEHSERPSGSSAYNFKRLFKLAIDNIISFSDKPLRLIIKMGFLISFITFLIGIYYACMYFMNRIEVLGFTSIMLSIWFLSGVIISILGTIGLYLGKTFEQVKGRPNFIIQKKISS